MKKTITITINNIVFQVEEEAYKKLNNYLKSIEKHYGSSRESREILADIESSIAEKFLKATNSKKQSLNLSDVKKMIKVMGTVEEFSREAGKNKEEKTRRGKSSEKIKRLYRNPDDTVVAGVCSGLAAYLGIDPIIVRLAFIFLVFVNGLGLLAYLVFLLIMPKAENSAQKLAMSGKPINLKKIEEVVKEKSKTLKKEGKQALNNLNRRKGLLYKIINFPVKIIGNAFSFMVKAFSKIWPVFSVFFGVIFLMIAFFSILALITATGLIMFNIDSPFLISDLPLESIVSSAMYYIGVISVGLIALIPLVFILMAGLTMVRRKNSCPAILSGFLVGLWMISIATGVVAVVDLAPEVRAEFIDEMERQSETRNYQYADFDKLYLGANFDVEVKQGSEFSIAIEGRKQDLDRLGFEIEDGQLQIVQRSRDQQNKLCFLCFERRMSAQVTMPEAKSFVFFRNVKAEVSGFKKDLYISLGESAEMKINLENQKIICKLSGTNSLLDLSGQVKNLDCELDGHARLKTENDFEAKEINLIQSVFSSSELKGIADKLTIKAEDYSRVNSDKLKSQEAAVNAYSHSRVEIYPIKLLKAGAFGNSHIVYWGDPEEIIFVEESNGEVIGNKFFRLE